MCRVGTYPLYCRALGVGTFYQHGLDRYPSIPAFPINRTPHPPGIFSSFFFFFSSLQLRAGRYLHRYVLNVWHHAPPPVAASFPPAHFSSSLSQNQSYQPAQLVDSIGVLIKLPSINPGPHYLYIVGTYTSL